MPQNILEPNQHWKAQAARPGFLDHVVQIDARAAFALRRANDAAIFVDVKIFRPPSVDVVKRAGSLDVPLWRSVIGITHDSKPFRDYRTGEKVFNDRDENFSRRRS